MYCLTDSSSPFVCSQTPLPLSPLFQFLFIFFHPVLSSPNKSVDKRCSDGGLAVTVSTSGLHIQILYISGSLQAQALRNSLHRRHAAQQFHTPFPKFNSSGYLDSLIILDDGIRKLVISWLS